MSSQEFQGFFPSSRQIAFEQNWAERHDVPAETMAQYRHSSREGYSLPDMATNFRTFCAALEWQSAFEPAEEKKQAVPPAPIFKFRQWYVGAFVESVMEIGRTTRQEAEQRLNSMIDLGEGDVPQLFELWRSAQYSVVVYLPPMNPKAGRLVTTLAKSMHNAYVKSIEAAGAKVVIQ